MVVNGSFLNTIIQNMHDGRDLESYCKYEKLNLIEIRRKATESSEKEKVSLFKRCIMVISNLLH